MSGKNQVLGRAYLCIDTVDLSSRDLVLRLDTGGHLQLKIDIEKETSDIRFKFGRAFRMLKRIEDDMVRVFVDKVSSRLCMSNVSVNPDHQAILESLESKVDTERHVFHFGLKRRPRETHCRISFGGGRQAH